MLENPSAPKDQWQIRPVIDPNTPETLGLGVYTHPELSWDATKLLFCFKGEPTGSTSIYEIGIDGRVPDPFTRKYAWHVRTDLDADAIDDADRGLFGVDADEQRLQGAGEAARREGDQGLRRGCQ